MNNIKVMLAGLLSITALAGCVEDTGSGDSAAAPGVETDLTYLEGARAGQAEFNITNQGYEAIRSQGLTTWWFNRATGSCARIVTSNGRYSKVDMLPAQDC